MGAGIIWHRIAENSLSFGFKPALCCFRMVQAEVYQQLEYAFLALSLSVAATRVPKKLGFGWHSKGSLNP